MRWSALILLVVSQAALAGGFTLRSADLKTTEQIPLEYTYHGYGCTGQNVSPQLSWQGAPADTKSYAITVYDPDAPTGAGWWHWVVYNVPASVHALAHGASAGDMPAGAVQALTSFSTHGYGGPCPPKGDKPHHYEFTVFALDVPELKLPADASPEMVGYTLHFHTLAKATFTALYGR